MSVGAGCDCVLGAGSSAGAVVWARAGKLMAAAPMLGIYPILGQRYGRQAEKSASLLVCTVASFGTLAAVIWGLHAAWGVRLPT